jgi:hypothetical protein
MEGKDTSTCRCLEERARRAFANLYLRICICKIERFLDYCRERLEQVLGILDATSYSMYRKGKVPEERRSRAGRESSKRMQLVENLDKLAIHFTCQSAGIIRS